MRYQLELNGNRKRRHFRFPIHDLAGCLPTIAVALSERFREERRRGILC